ncbi:MAG: SpaH/EbpB family LPXTG-anchored major pilin [Oscillospiraceae bacterium]|nr:SpaH/EbpB family LPXTG-anchored major pilin [Oscillospiraceae bacterium]
MKKLRKIVSLLLAVAMLMSICAVQVGATAGSAGTIVIKDASEGTEFSAYKMLDLTYDSTSGSYAYTIADGWEDFFTDTGIDDVYVTLTTVGSVTYVTWKDGVSQDSTTLQAFANAAKTYAESNTGSITPVTATADSSGTATFTGLDLGYYFVSSSTGTLIALDSTENYVEIVDKNAKPQVTKTVYNEEDADFDETSTSTSIDLTDTVYYQVKIEGIDEITTLVLHDALPDGFELTSGSISVKLYYYDAQSELQNVTLATTTDYTIDDSPSCSVTGCDFEVDFTALIAQTSSGNYYDYVLSVSDPASSYLIVSYSATVTDSSEISYGNDQGDGNVNTVTLESDVERTSTATVYTYDIYVYKFTADSDTDLPGTALEGATFTLSDGTNYAVFITDTDGNYVLSSWSSTVVENNSGASSYITTGSDGLLHVIGLDDGSYYLTETTAPDGYALISGSKTITIYEGAVTTDTYAYSTDIAASTVYNSKSSEMPSTGGIGTTIFYVVGGVLVLGAIIMIITRKRMKSDEE